MDDNNIYIVDGGEVEIARFPINGSNGLPSAKAWIARVRPPFKHVKLPNKRLAQGAILPRMEMAPAYYAAG
jgi:hypothetical protein